MEPSIAITLADQMAGMMIGGGAEGIPPPRRRAITDDSVTRQECTFVKIVLPSDAAIGGCGGAAAVLTSSGTMLPAGVIIGELEGTPKDISEVYHTDYLSLTGSWVLDVQVPWERNILTWVAEDNNTFSPLNCRIVRDLATQRFYLKTIYNIGANTELVYTIQAYTEEYLDRQ